MNENGSFRIYVPDNPSVIRDRLKGLGRVINSKEWERAAYVATLCAPGKRGPKVSGTSTENKMSITELRKEGIRGLTTDRAIRAYLKAWAMSGQETPKPGGKVDLPSGEFPPADVLYNRAKDGPEPVDEPDDMDGKGDQEDKPRNTKSKPGSPPTDPHRSPARQFQIEFADPVTRVSSTLDELIDKVGYGDKLDTPVPPEMLTALANLEQRARELRKWLMAQGGSARRRRASGQ